MRLKALTFLQKIKMRDTMPQDTHLIDEFKTLMESALFQLQELTKHDHPQRIDFVQLVNIFLQSIISASVDLLGSSYPESAPYLYSEIEAIARSGGLLAIQKRHSKGDHLMDSVSHVDPGDQFGAINYLGQHLSIALFKGIYELPPAHRNEEMLLKGVEALLTNLLHQKFDHPHEVLDFFYEHVGLALDELKKTALRKPTTLH